MTVSSLTFRPALQSDLPELIKMRIACGWNEDAIEAYLERSLPGTTDLLYIFELEGAPVGMGALELENDDPDLASVETGTVCLSWLFLYQKYQGRTLGNLMVQMLEDRARALNKKTITIHTRNQAHDSKGKDTADESRNKLWYKRHGYEEFKPPQGRYDMGPGEPLLVACFMSKSLA